MFIPRIIKLSNVFRWLSLVCFIALGANVWAGGILQIRNGYFWDPATAENFVPRGISYQTWNPPVGANQTFDQLEYDFIEFKKMHANSVRAEFVWNEVEKTNGVYDWTKPDFMVAKAEELGLRLFILVGFQYAPNWFPDDWKAINQDGERSVVLNYEHPEARRACSNFIYRAASRYKNSGTIGGWILGNEYAYFDLWEVTHRFLGFDPITQASFRNYLSSLYSGSIAALNTNWGTSYSNFNAVVMPPSYPANRNNPGYHDLIQWRKKSVGDYVAVGAVAAKKADPNHLRTYSMVGGIFSGDDALNTCEDAPAIVARCAAAGAPLDFWSINNYAWASVGSELRSADYGIAKYQAQAGLPVMISETGHSSTENLFPGASERQPKAIPSTLWESVVSGAIGVHLFHWSDRSLFGGVFIREKGFGIVNQDRTIKDPVYWYVADMFRRMENLNLDHLLGGSLNPKADIQYFWGQSADMGWPRANQENAMLWGALRRLGYQPGLLDDAQFERGDYTNAPALLLSRCFQMNPAHLEKIATNVIPAGVHVHANADLPGQFDAYHRPNTNWISRMSSLFGLNVSNAVPGYDLGVSYVGYDGTVYLTGVSSLGAFSPSYSDHLGTWKIWHGVKASSGTTIVTHTGNQGTQLPMPALQVKNLGTAKTAINTFALADTYGGSNPAPAQHQWDIRYDWLRAIYRTHFGITPAIDLTGPGAQYVLPDYRVCRNGSILISLLNEHTKTASVTLTATNLLRGKTVENLTTGGIVETNSDGVIQVNLSDDEFVLLYAYNSVSGVDQSLINSNPNKLWIQSAPPAVWPSGSNSNLTIGYDTRDTNLTLFASVERVLLPSKVFGKSAASMVGGKGTAVIAVPVPDADPNDIDYVSSHDGGKYVFHAWLEKNGARVSETFLPVRLLWGVRPLALPPSVIAGSNYQITLEWQELPSYEPAENPTPLSRADLWEPLKGSSQYYNVVLELRSAGQLVASNSFLTSTGTDRHTFSLAVPANASGPFTWSAYLQSAPGASVDVKDSFEDRSQGNDVATFSPWLSYVYSQNNNALSVAQGVDAQASDGKQAIFMVIQNPANPGDFSGFGLQYIYDHTWSLPHDSKLWTNYTFAIDFKESFSHPCVVELQVKDALGGQIHFTKTYQPGANLWDTLKPSLDQFTIPPWIGYFDSTRVQEIVINVQMLQANVTYQASIDNIRFDAPEKASPVAAPVDVWDSFEDRMGGADPLLTSPWGSYVYSEFNTAYWLAQGINSEASNGGRAAFLIVTNPPNSGSFAGFGMYYIFTNEWSLPTNHGLWTNYIFSYDFRENHSRRCVLEMQIKSSATNWIEFTKTYTPGSNRWDTIRASVNQFVAPPGVGAFDPARVQSITVNLRMLDNGATFEGLFDNIFFDGPDQLLPNGTKSASYASANDSLRDSDHDGLPDIYETGTGIYVSPTNTGTNPNKADTDGDGIGDREELIAGTNPNLAGDLLRIAGVRQSTNGQPILSWQARTNRIYSAYYLEGSQFPGGAFVPLGALTNLTVPTNGLFEVTDPAPLPIGQRFYRITVHAP